MLYLYFHFIFPKEKKESYRLTFIVHFKEREAVAAPPPPFLPPDGGGQFQGGQQPPDYSAYPGAVQPPYMPAPPPNVIVVHKVLHKSSICRFKCSVP